MDEDANLASLARRARGGDGEATARLLRKLRPAIVRTTRLVVGAGSDAAEDAAQDAMLDVARQVGNLRDPELARAWALRIASRRAVRAARTERWRRRWRADEDALDRADAAEGADARGAALKRAFDALPPRQRVVAVLRLHAGLGEAEVAEILGVPVGTVKSRFNVARRRLAADLAVDGFAPQTLAPAPPRP